jgi:protein involved in polysaccharide export with SLBB domain
LGLALFLAASAASVQAADTDSRDSTGTGAGANVSSADSSVIRLQQPLDDRATGGIREAGNDRDFRPQTKAVYVPSEFERYVQRAADLGNARSTESVRDGVQPLEIRRFGAELMSPTGRTGMPAEPESGAQIPQDYVLSVGDEVLVTLWGSVSADLRLTVDRGGRITIPRIGPVLVAGLHYADLNPAIDQRVAQVFRNYKLSTSLGRLRSIRVYVTGFTQRPGAYTVSSLATLVNGLMQAGGPSAAGSFRNIELRRGGKLVSSFDFYDLLLKGDKTADRSLQAEDVIFIGAIGPQVALIGSVNKPAVFELKPGETVNDVVRMAGGFTALADRARLTVEHIADRDSQRVTLLALPAAGSEQPLNGDLMRAFSAVDAVLPQYKQNKRVRIEGEVQHPGEFVLPASSTLADAIQAAGGLTRDAYVYGTDFSRESVRQTQQDNYDRALRDLETEFTRNATTQRATSADDAAALAAKSQNSSKLIERLRAVRPTGRIVLQMDPSSPKLPALVLEDGDRLVIPARPNTVGVFGSVFNGGSYLYANGETLSDFLKLAGGPTRGADADSAFVLRANGSVVSARQKSSGWLSVGGIDSLQAEPGDTIFVPESLDKTTFIQSAKDWTQILYQFGLGAAALKTIRQ